MTLTFLCGLMQTRTIRNALIVAPLSVLRSWQKESYKVMGSRVSIEMVLSSDSKHHLQIALRNALRWYVRAQ